MTSRKITLEEHFTTPEFSSFEEDFFKAIKPDVAKPVQQKISDFTEFRLSEMDDNGIDMQMLSLTSPGLQAEADPEAAVTQAKKVNDFLAEVVASHPTRFAGFATLPCQRPEEAADELERTVTQLGFKGAMVNGHTRGEYLDEQKFRVIWERAASLGVPIYLHPADPYEPWQTTKGYPELTGAMWGWAFETGTHALRIILAGVFDEFPDLTLILGHMGEMLPFCLWRIDDRWQCMADDRGLSKLPSQYIRDNIMVTTAGVFSFEPLLCTQLALGADRIVFSVDYPYQATSDAVRFIETAPLSPTDREKICHGNAERLLGL